MPAATGGGVRPPVTAGGLTLKRLRPEHWPDVARVYAEGIATRNATFETDVPSWEDWDGAHLADHRFVAEWNGKVAGWITLAPVSSRCCYAGVAEVSAYVGEEARGRGVGTALLETVIESSEAAGVWTLETGVFPENEPSLALLKRFGFREVGVRERIGRLDDVWRDVLLFERRSEVIE